MSWSGIGNWFTWYTISGSGHWGPRCSKLDYRIAVCPGSLLEKLNCRLCSKPPEWKKKKKKKKNLQKTWNLWLLTKKKLNWRVLLPQTNLAGLYNWMTATFCLIHLPLVQDIWYAVNCSFHIHGICLTWSIVVHMENKPCTGFPRKGASSLPTRVFRITT